MLRLLFDHILRHVPKQWRCDTLTSKRLCMAAVPTWSLQLESSKRQSIWRLCKNSETSRPASNWNQTLQFQQRESWEALLASGRRASNTFTAHCPRQDKCPYETSIMLSFQRMNLSTVFKKDGTKQTTNMTLQTNQLLRLTFYHQKHGGRTIGN